MHEEAKPNGILLYNMVTQNTEKLEWSSYQFVSKTMPCLKGVNTNRGHKYAEKHTHFLSKINPSHVPDVFTIYMEKCPDL